MTLIAIEYIWKFLTSGRARTNSSQPLFINDGCISLFSPQQHLRNLASRLLKFGLAKSFSVEMLVSSTVLVCCLIVIQTTPPGCYTQLTSSSLHWKKRSITTSHCSLRRSGKMRWTNMILPVFHILKLARIFSSTLKHVLIFPEVKRTILSLLFSNQ